MEGDISKDMSFDGGLFGKVRLPGSPSCYWMHHHGAQLRESLATTPGGERNTNFLHAFMKSFLMVWCTCLR